MSADVKIFQSLDAVAQDAGEALDRAHQGRLYDRLDWFRRTQEFVLDAPKPLIARSRNADGTAWLFLNAQSSSAASALAGWYTLDFATVTIGDPAEAIAALPSALPIAHISLQPMGAPERLTTAFKAAGWRVYSEQCSENWFVRPQGDFEAYWATRPSRLRNTVKRKTKKAQLDIQIYRVFNEQAWADYRAIYARSWKPEEGSWPFMRDFAQTEGDAGALRLGVAYKDGEPLAAQLWTVENGQATIHKLAYTEDSKALSPGSILGKAMFEHVIDRDRPAIIDYGTGSEPYKADWMDEVRPLYRLDLYNPRKPASWPVLGKRIISGLVRSGKPS